MKIILIDNSIAYTGAFKCALNEALILSPNCQVIFILPSNSPVVSIARQAGFKVYTIPFRELSKSLPSIVLYPISLLKNAVSFKRIVKNEQPDLIQVNDFYNLLGVGLKLLGYTGRLITYVRLLPSNLPTLYRNPLLWLAYKYSDKVVAVSDAVLRQLKPSKKTIRIYDPIVQLDSQDWHERSANTPSVRMLYLANFIKGKGQDYAIEAFRIAYGNNKNLSLKLVGGDMGLAKNKVYKTELIKAVNRFNLQEVVSFHEFSEHVEREFKEADIFLNFSDSESFSMTTLEAAHYGTPSIVTACGGPEEIIRNGETGIVVNKGDVNGMASAIIKLAGDQYLRSQFSNASRKYVSKKFDINTFKERFFELIHHAS